MDKRWQDYNPKNFECCRECLSSPSATITSILQEIKMMDKSVVATMKVIAKHLEKMSNNVNDAKKVKAQPLSIMKK